MDERAVQSRAPHAFQRGVEPLRTLRMIEARVVPAEDRGGVDVHGLLLNLLSIWRSVAYRYGASGIAPGFSRTGRWQ